MAMQTYKGSCHCGKVKFEADLDIEKGTSKCNCTFCWKNRVWASLARPEQVRVTAGEGELNQYARVAQAQNEFCKTCGTRLFWRGDIPNMGKVVIVSVAALDDLPVEKLIEAPVTYLDGRHDKFWQPPVETRHL